MPPANSGATGNGGAKNSGKGDGPQPIDCNVRVVVRTRPMLTLEKRRNCSNALTHNVAARSISIKGGERGARSFTYDGVIPSRVNQLDTYKTTAQPMIDSYFQGYNQTVMAYGQTGSGKTFTMGTAADDSDSRIDSDSGILPRFIVDAFKRIETLRETKDITTTVSFLEVYNEQLKDLLVREDNTAAGMSRHGSGSRGGYGHNLTIVEGKSGNKSVRVVGLSEIKVSSVEDVLDALARGTESRTTASTLMNNTSSRSHAVFTLTMVQKPKIAVVHSDEEGGNEAAISADDQAMVSKATFVDLAGSERIKRTGAEGKRKEEGISINEGLLALGRVINALADEETLRKGIRGHVPYRNSKLTRLLQDALGGNSRTLFIACVSPADDNCEETLGTLRYAHQARNIKNAAVLNVDPRAELLGRLQRERQAFLHQALIYRFSAFEASLDDLMKREDVKAYVSSILEQINPDMAVDTSWGLSTRGSAAGAKQSPSGTASPREARGTRGAGANKRGGSRGANSRAPKLPAPSGSATSRSSSRDGGAKTKAKTERENVAALTETQEMAIKSLEDSDFQELLETQQNTILEQELEVEKRDRLAARETEAHNEQVDSLRVQISTKEDLLRTIKDSLTRFNELKEKEKQHVEQLRESEAERQRLEKQLKKKEKPSATNAARRKQLEKKYKVVVDRLKSLKNEHQRQQFLLRNLEREAKRASDLERAIGVLKGEKVSLARARKREIQEHREWKKGKEHELKRLRKMQLKQKREMQSVMADRERQRIRLERRGDQLQHAAARLRETRMELVALLQKKNKLSRRRNASIRHISKRNPAKEAKSLKLEEQAKQSFRAHAVHSKLMLLQQEIMRRAAIQAKEEELERELEKRQQLLLQLTNLVGARQQLAEDGLGDLSEETGGPPATEEEQAEALSIELSNIDSKIEACEMKIAAVTGTLQECTSELKVLNSENRARNATSKKKAAVDEDDSGIDPVARTVLDKGTTEEEAQYMMTQLMNLACELQTTNSSDKKALKLAEAQQEEAEAELQNQVKRFRRLEHQWEKANARAVADYEKDILAIVKHGVADSILSPSVDTKAASKTAAETTPATPLERNRQNKVTDLLREKVAELEALASEREKNKAEISELQEKCDQLQKTLALTRSNPSPKKAPSPSKPGESTSDRVAALTRTWKELGVDSETQKKIMEDLQLSVDERADKYILHLSEVYANEQESIVTLETEITQKLRTLGKEYVAANVYHSSGSVEVPMDSVLEKKRKLEEYLENVNAQVEKQTGRYSELRTRARELVDELDVKQDEMGDELRSLLNTEMPESFPYKSMVSLEGAVRALIVTKSERLVIVQQRCRRLKKTLQLLGLKPLDCLPCFKKFSRLSPRKNPLYNDVESMRELCLILDDDDFSMSKLSLDPLTVRKLTLLNKTMEHVKAHRVGSITVLCSILADVQYASDTPEQRKQREKLSTELVERLNQLVGPLEEGPLALRTLELLVGKLRKNYDALQQLHATARKDLDEQWNAIKYPIEKREKFLAIVEGEKVEAAKRKLSQVLEMETPPQSVTNLSITGLENHSWPIPDLALVYGACQSMLRLRSELERLAVAASDADRIITMFEQLQRLEEGMEKFNAEVKENKDRWKGRSTNFKLEEKTRKRFAAQYPKLLSQLISKLERYESTFQEKFMIKGRELMPVLQEIVAANGSNNTNFELMQLRLQSVGILRVFHGNHGSIEPQQDQYTRDLLENASPQTKHSQKMTKAAEAESYEGGACSKCGQPGHTKFNCPHSQLRGGR